jgi:hypothetical protein
MKLGSKQLNLSKLFGELLKKQFFHFLYLIFKELFRELLVLLLNKITKYVNFLNVSRLRKLFKTPNSLLELSIAP